MTRRFVRLSNQLYITLVVEPKPNRECLTHDLPMLDSDGHL